MELKQLAIKKEEEWKEEGERQAELARLYGDALALAEQLRIEAEAKRLQREEKFNQQERWAEFARLKEEKIKAAELSE